MRTEASLLKKIESAQTLAEKRKWVAELMRFRKARSEQVAAERELDLAEAIIRDVTTPAPVHELHTAATDWLDEVVASSDDYDIQMRAKATTWFKNLHPAVVADRDEFAEQAMGMARRESGRYGEYAEEAYQAFLRQASRQWKQAVEFAPGEVDEVGRLHRLAGEYGRPDTGAKYSLMVNGVTHYFDDEAEARAYKANMDSLYGATSGLVGPVVKMAAGDSPGQVNEEQSGNAESTVTDYDTEGSDSEPMFSEDFDGEDDTGSQIGSGVHPEMPGAQGSDLEPETFDNLSTAEARRRRVRKQAGLREEYLDEAGGDPVKAAILLAGDLMVGDPETFRGGYSLDNAILAAIDIFPEVTPDQISPRLSNARKRGGLGKGRGGRTVGLPRSAASRKRVANFNVGDKVKDASGQTYKVLDRGVSEYPGGGETIYNLEVLDGPKKGYATTSVGLELTAVSSRKASRKTAFTTRDIARLLLREDHLGFGYASAHGLTPEQKEALDEAVAQVATELGLSEDDFFMWLNSRPARWTLDSATMGGDPVATVKKFLNASIVDSLRAEGRKKTAATPDWLRERVNDPYGTPNSHEFWTTVDFEDIDKVRVFEKDGKGYLYHRVQNYWMHFDSLDAARQHAQSMNQSLDMWATRKKAASDEEVMAELGRAWSQLNERFPGLADQADEAYDRADQGWFNGLSTEQLVALWEGNPMGMNASWDDEVYEALYARGHFAAKARKKAQKSAAITEEMEVVVEAENINDAQAKAQEMYPDFIVGMTGYAAGGQWRVRLFKVDEPLVRVVDIDTRLQEAQATRKTATSYWVYTADGELEIGGPYENYESAKSALTEHSGKGPLQVMREEDDGELTPTGDRVTGRKTSTTRNTLADPNVWKKLEALPRLYATDGQKGDRPAVKLFDPYGSAWWVLWEYDPSSKEAFGYAELFPGGGELGYVDVGELAELAFMGQKGLRIERDAGVTTMVEGFRSRGATPPSFIMASRTPTVNQVWANWKRASRKGQRVATGYADYLSWSSYLDGLVEDGRVDVLQEEVDALNAEILSGSYPHPTLDDAQISRDMAENALRRAKERVTASRKQAAFGVYDEWFNEGRLIAGPFETREEAAAAMSQVDYPFTFSEGPETVVGDPFIQSLGSKTAVSIDWGFEDFVDEASGVASKITMGLGDDGNTYTVYEMNDGSWAFDIEGVLPGGYLTVDGFATEEDAKKAAESGQRSTMARRRKGARA